MISKDAKITCRRCRDGFMKVGEDKCEKMSSDFDNCRNGVPTECRECHSNYIRKAGDKQCSHVKAEDLVYGCDNYREFSGKVVCDQCAPGLVQVSGKCLIDYVQE